MLMAKKKSKYKGRKRKKKFQIKVSVWFVAAVLLTLGAFISLPYFKDLKSAEKGERVPEGYHCYGIDISKYQPHVQWDSLKVMTNARGETIRSKTYAKDIKSVSYVFIKATEGTTLKDRHFHKHWNDASEAGIRKGAYHFFRTSKDPAQQARHFISTVGKISEADLPPVLDIETIHQGCSKKELNDKIRIWLETVEKHYGRKPIIYSSASFLKDNISKDLTDSYPIWVAHYNTTSPRWNDWKFWQFSDKAVVYGISGYVDLNVCTIKTLKSL